MLPASLGYRIAYDRGAVGFLRQSKTYGGSWIDVGPEWITALNTEAQVGAYVSYSSSAPQIWDFLANDSTDIIGYVLLLPEPITLRAVFATIGGSVSPLGTNDFGGGEGRTATVRMQVSTDSYNGIDGEWTDLENVTSMSKSVSGGASPPEWISGKALDVYGTEIVTNSNVPGERQRVEGPSTMDMDTLWTPESPSGVHVVGPYSHVRAIRILFTSLFLSGAGNDYRKGGYAARLHLYGEVEDSRSTRQFLGLWHPNLERRILPEYLDWGSVMPSTSSDKSFRLRNFSPDKTAYGITIDAKNLLWQNFPLTDQQFLFSLDRLHWTPTVKLGALSPNGVSQLVHVRRDTPFNTPEGFKSFRIEVDVEEWS